MAWAISRSMSDFLRGRAERRGVHQSLQRFLLAHHADAARNALAAGFMAEETRDAQQNLAQIDRVIEQHDHAGTQRGADGARAFKSERRIEFVRPDKSSGRAAQKNCLQLAAARHASGKINQLAQRGPHGDFVDAGARHVSAKTKEPGAGGVFRAQLGVSRAAFEDDAGNVDQRFHVVDRGGLAEESRLRGERRLVARFAAIAFDRVEERGFFAADIRAGAAANFNVELKAAAQNVVAEESVFIGRLDGVSHPLGGQRIFSAQVDITFAARR